MARRFNGMPCGICGRPILEGQSKRMFPPFVANRRSPIALFNDAVVHTSCFESHPHFEAARADLERTLAQRTRPRLCDLCGLDDVPPETPPRDAPDAFVRDFVIVQRITEDESQPAARFNFFKAHRKCMREAGLDREMSRALDALGETSEWDPGDLNHLKSYLRL